MMLSILFGSRRPATAFVFRLLTVLAIFIVLPHPVRCTTPDERLAVAHVAGLRKQVADSQLAYGRALAPDLTVGVDAVSHVENLRTELRNALLSSVDQGSGSDALLSIHRANVESILEVIHAFEAAIGHPPDRWSTPWNILSSEELTALRSQALERLTSVQRSLDSLGAAERPPFLLFRQREIASWIAAIDKEQNLRAAGGSRAPPQIDQNISLTEARARFRTIPLAEGRLRSSFDQHLAFQIELRLTHSPRDSAMLALRDRLPKSPFRIVPTTAARPPPTSEAALADLDSALKADKAATLTRDPISRAKARARATTDLEWLKATGFSRQTNSEWGLDLVSDETLTILRKDYLAWRLHLESEAIAGGSPTVDRETRDVNRLLEQIDAELDRRSFGWGPNDQLPPEDPSLWLPARPTPPPQPGGGSTTELRAYETTMKSRQLSLELLYLQQEKDLEGPPVNVALQNELQKTASALESENASLFSLAKKAVAETESNLLEDGRGTQAAIEGERVLKAKKIIQTNGSPSEALTAVEKSAYFHAQKRSESTLRILSERSQMDAGPAGKPEMIEIPVRPQASTNPPRGISGFDDHFPATSLEKDNWTRSFRGVIQDIERAPGGVVVDAHLPEQWKQHISKAKVDTSNGSFSLLVDGQWSRVEPSVDAEFLRLTYAFVRDGRVMPIDLRNLNLDETAWVVRQMVSSSGVLPVRSDYPKLLEALATLTSVNLHPALRNTSLAIKLIYVDQFIFDLLPDQLDPTPLYGSSSRFGLDIGPLRSLYLLDFHDLSNPAAWRSLFQKSIISSIQVDVTHDNDRFRVSPILQFAIYRLPAAKNNGPTILLKHSTNWLQENESRLKGAAALNGLVQLAATSAIMRTVLENGIENNFDELLIVPVTESPTPRLLCRPEGREPCGLHTLQESLESNYGRTTHD
jgi:hypothetical protein